MIHSLSLHLQSILTPPYSEFSVSFYFSLLSLSPLHPYLLILFTPHFAQVSCLARACIDALDHALRLLTGLDIFFGGKVVVFCGDLRQTPPIIPHAEIAAPSAVSVKRTLVWQQGGVQILRLDRNMRLCTSAAPYAAWTLQVRLTPSPVHSPSLLSLMRSQVGDGRIPATPHHPLSIPLPDELMMPEDYLISDLIQHTFPDLDQFTHPAAPSLLREQYFMDR